MATPIDALNALLGSGGPSSSTSQHEVSQNSTTSPKTPLLYTAQVSSSSTSAPAPSEIFDGYSFFSRQEEEKAEDKNTADDNGEKEKQLDKKTSEAGGTNEAGTPNVVRPKKLPLLSHRPKVPAPPARSKLAALADMYGMNESSYPQPPLPPASIANPSTIGTNMTNQQQATYSTTQSALPPQPRPQTHNINPAAALQQAAAIQASQNAWLMAAHAATAWQQHQRPQQFPLLNTPVIPMMGGPVGAATAAVTNPAVSGAAFTAGAFQPNPGFGLMLPNYYSGPGGPILRPPSQWRP